MNQSQFTQDVRRYLSVVHKRRAIIITALALSLLVAVLYNYTTRPLYQATAQILIDRNTPRVLPTTQMVDQGVQDFHTEYELLRGRAVAEKVVEKLKLTQSPELMAGPMMSPWERFQRRFMGKQPEPVVDHEGMPLSPTAAAVRSRLTVLPLPGGRLVNLRFVSYDPDLAASVANTIADVYIQQSLEFRYTRSSQATDWLGERLKEQKAKVEAAERALVDYQARHGLVQTGDGLGEGQDRVAALAAAVTAARMERTAKESLLYQAQQLSGAQLASFPAVSGSAGVIDARGRLSELQAQVSRMSETYGDKHPDMVRARSEMAAAEQRLYTEARQALRTLENDVAAARGREASLQADLEKAKSAGFDVSRKSIDHDALRREVETNRQLYQALMSRSKETDLESELKTANVRLVEAAEVPRGPVSPNRNRNYRMALALGLALGLGLAFLFEHLDNTVKTPDDVKELGLPFLGMVPEAGGLPLPNARGMLRAGDGPLAEAYRVLRTNLLFTSAEPRGRVVLLSSANPGEGKTTTAANIAGALALNGAKVLVVDADLRRPTLHQQFTISKSPGLTDLLVSKTSATEAIRGTRYKGLFVLPCGYTPPNPAELLGSTAMREILDVLRSHYDWVLVDTPPILAMADTPVLCRVADGVVLVMRAEETSRPSIERAVEAIASVGGKVIGAVLNRVDLRRNAYYYGHYYGEYYRSYYSSAADRPAPSRNPRPPRSLGR